MPRLAHVLAHLQEQHQRSVGNSAIAAEYAETLVWLTRWASFDDSAPRRMSGTVDGTYYEYGDMPVFVDIHEPPALDATMPATSHPALGVETHLGMPAVDTGDPDNG